MKSAWWIGVGLLLALWLVAARARGEPAAVATELMGLGRIELPAGYRLRGLSETVDGGLPPNRYVELDHHRDTRAYSFVFEKDPSNDWGGNAEESNLLCATVFNPASPGLDDWLRGPVRLPRLVHGFGEGPIVNQASGWRHEQVGTRGWRWREAPVKPERWVVVLVDTDRNLRLDLYIWKKKTTLEQARALLAAAADSYRPPADLAARFEHAAQYPARMARRLIDNQAKARAALQPLGLAPLEPGRPVFARAGAALLDDRRVSLTVVRSLGSVALGPSVERGAQGWPRLPRVDKPPDFRPWESVNALSALTVLVAHWHPAASRWRIAELDRANDRSDDLPALLGTVVQRLADRDSAHLFLAVEYWRGPALDDVSRLDDFLQRADRLQRDLAAGLVLRLPVSPP